MAEQAQAKKQALFQITVETYMAMLCNPNHSHTTPEELMTQAAAHADIIMDFETALNEECKH